jgi:hypothetical protein
MANTSRINGFRPVKHANGSPYNGQCNIYAVRAADGTALFVGDPVAQDTVGHTNGVPTVIRAAAGAPVIGVVVGILPAKFDPVGGTMSAGSITLDTPVYRPASTLQYVLVCDAPDVYYEVEASTTALAAYAFAVTDIGKNADFVATGSGSTTTGTSAAALDMSTAANTATLQFRVMGTVQRPDNEPTGNYTKVLAKVNNHYLANGAAGV